MSHRGLGGLTRINFDDFIEDPVNYKDREFRDIIRSSGDPPAPVQAFRALRDQLFQAVRDEDFKKVDLLNTLEGRNIQDRHVYRFRCMIQDHIRMDEFFLAGYRTDTGEQKTAFLSEGIDDEEELDVNMDEIGQRLQPRQIYNCVSIPAENQWYKSAVEEASFAPDPQPASTNGLAKLKEKYTNFPLSTMKAWAKTVMVKVCNEEWVFPLNTMVEFVGVLFKEDEPQLNEYEIDVLLEEHNQMEDFYYPPFWIVPRLHAICYRIIPPFAETYNFQPRGLDISNSSTFLISSVRECITDILTSICMGDCLTARYILLNLLSKVRNWSNELSIGKFCINIYGPINPDLVTKLYSALKALVPRSVLLDGLKNNINAESIVPGRKERMLIVKSAILQLPSQTHLFVYDNVPPADLSPVGIVNQHVLQGLAVCQRLKYDIPYFDRRFQLDCPMIVASPLPSKIETDVAVPLRPTTAQLTLVPNLSEISSDEKVLNDTLNYCRDYISGLKMCEVSMPDEVETEIQQHFVESRASGSERRLTEEDFSSLLTMTRYIAMSYGSKTIEMKHWIEANQMENERQQRLLGEE